MKLAAVLFTMAVVASIGCGDDPPKSYPTYQMCFDDLTMAKMMLVPDAIVMCCLDHPINGMSPACGDIKADCINFLTANLMQTSASTTEVMDSCAEYISQKNMMSK
jgi:hypothetical protein